MKNKYVKINEEQNSKRQKPKLVKRKTKSYKIKRHKTRT